MRNERMTYARQELNLAAMDAARARWDGVAKPLRSLGLLEDMIVQIAGIRSTADVCLNRRCVLVFCGDHGVVAEGVTQSASDVTARVAEAIAHGNANVNLMAAACGADVFCVDMGMAADVPGVIARKSAPGTGNIAHGPAMTRAQAEQALQAGMDLVGEMKKRGYDIIATGEMGIGNTTPTAALACALLGLDPEEMTGRGAGLSDAGLTRKLQTVRRALAINQPLDSQLDILAKLGGFEIAGLVGAFLGGMTHGLPVIIDGVISAVAALLAARICPEAKGYMLPSHMSREPAARHVMDALGLEPVIHAGLALGEGTGAVMLIPLLDMALRVYAGSHTFDSLGMDAYVDQGGKP